MLIRSVATSVLAFSCLASMAYAESCSVTEDIVILSDSCVAAGKNNVIYGGSETFRCGPLNVTAPENYLLAKNTISVAVDLGAGELTSPRVASDSITPERPDYGFTLNQIPDTARISVACKTDRGAGSNCRASVVLQALAIRVECFADGTMFVLE